MQSLPRPLWERIGSPGEAEPNRGANLVRGILPRSDEGCRRGENVDRIMPASLWKPPISALLRFSSRPFLHALSSSFIIAVSSFHREHRS